LNLNSLPDRVQAPIRGKSNIAASKCRILQELLRINCSILISHPDFTTL
jgi:hypothetical protein